MAVLGGERSVCHVLIIEDDPLVALDLQAILEEHGATSFDFAESETEAVRAGRLRRPDVITSDVKLVEGTGPRAVKVLCDVWGDLPVIFITGTPEACSPCEPPGRIISKPVNSTEIIKTFCELMAQ